MSVSFDGRLLEALAKNPDLLQDIFDTLPDVLFYVKDLKGRYLWANRALVERSGCIDRAAVYGRTADELFPVFGPTTLAQDLEVMRSARPIRELLRVYWTFERQRYWCLSSKFPLCDRSGGIMGLAGLSRDLPHPEKRHRSYHRLSRFVAYIDKHYTHSVPIEEAARSASISADTLCRLVHEVFHVTPKQLLMKKRIDRACFLLETTGKSITEVSSSCGYCDHSAFTRQFKATTQVTPTQYRKAHIA